jgi:hypothetical protein
VLLVLLEEQKQQRKGRGRRGVGSRRLSGITRSPSSGPEDGGAGNDTLLIDMTVGSVTDGLDARHHPLNPYKNLAPCLRVSRHPAPQSIQSTQRRSLAPTRARTMDGLPREILVERAKLARKVEQPDGMLSPIPCPSALILSVLGLGELRFVQRVWHGIRRF